MSFYEYIYLNIKIKNNVELQMKVLIIYDIYFLSPFKKICHNLITFLLVNGFTFILSYDTLDGR